MIGLAIAVLLLAAPGSGGARDPDIQEWSLEEVRRVGAKFGECVVKKRPLEARAFILYDPSAKDEDKERKRLVAKVADGMCLVEAAKSSRGTEMRFPGDTMRYALADALFRLELSDSVPPRDFNQVPLLQHPVLDEADFQPKPSKRIYAKLAAELAERRDKELSRIVFSRFGECVVRIDPRNSHALLRTDVLTPAENAAFAALKDGLSVCVPENSTVALNKMTVRGTVAYNYYRLAQAAPGALAEPKIGGVKN